MKTRTLSFLVLVALVVGGLSWSLGKLEELRGTVHAGQTVEVSR